MLRKYASAIVVFTTLALAMTVVFAVRPVGAASVNPVFVAGNPTCQDLGYDYGFKVDPPDGGTYTIPGTSHTVTVTTDGTYFDWSSTLGMDAVISKGGPNANLYIYDPPTESFGDTDLVSPNNPSGGPAGLSHIEFCFDYEVTVEKTANTSYTLTYAWTIDKSVTPETWDLFTGDNGTSEYTVGVTKDQGTPSNWAVSGEIKIDNNTPFDATILGVLDEISGIGLVSVSCPVNFPYILSTGNDFTCTYSTGLPNGDNRTNTATVTTIGAVGSGSNQADVDFTTATVTKVNDQINVDDTNGGTWPFGNSGSVSYPKTFACDGDEGSHSNTATIRETGQSDSASVTVNCHALSVEKGADEALTRTWSWTIDKSADQTDLLLTPDQLFQVNYEVKVGATSTESNWAVSGLIDVYNPAPIDATINSVSDIVSPDIAATVNCGVTFPYTLAAGATLPCIYSSDLPDATNRTNTAIATLQNYSYDKDGNATPGGTTDFSKTVNITFDENTTVSKVDECIDVTDTNTGFLGTVCAGVDTLPKVFTYSLWFGDHPDADVILECGENTHPNIADFVTNDTDATGSDNWTVNATVECFVGCTLTQGYWKTHSEFGPAPYDNTWEQLANGASTSFYLSSQTWHQVFWTAPAGNVYYNLADQFMAAKLNILSGASSTPAVDTALAQAESLFNTTTPAQAATLKGSAKNTWTTLAATLNSYNNGKIGPGHCSE